MQVVWGVHRRVHVCNVKCGLCVCRSLQCCVVSVVPGVFAHISSTMSSSCPRQYILSFLGGTVAALRVTKHTGTLTESTSLLKEIGTNGEGIDRKSWRK